MNITIVGATGNVGRKIIEILEKKNFPVDALYLVASSKSAGSKLRFNEKSLKIGELRSGTYSPHFKKVIGIAMLNKPYFEVSQTFKISINDSTFEGKVCDLPFI